uniref:Mitochondrial pyruvate carrier n=1 Tax=Ciona savignyi TaxID=51511 RepID=H2Z8I5_CIOSA
MSGAWRQALVKLDTKVQSRMSDKLKEKWNHPAGMKTIHFWAPAFKWSLVIAGLSDYFRPPEKLSINQSASLMATGLIWSRYSMVIIPKNWLLFSVNICLGLTGGFQVARILRYQQTQKSIEVEK